MWFCKARHLVRKIAISRGGCQGAGPEARGFRDEGLDAVGHVLQDPRRFFESSSSSLGNLPSSAVSLRRAAASAFFFLCSFVSAARSNAKRTPTSQSGNLPSRVIFAWLGHSLNTRT